MAMMCASIQATPQKRFGFDDFEKFGYKPKTSNPWNTDTRYRHNSFPYTKPNIGWNEGCLLYTSPSPRDVEESRMPSSA